MKKRGIQNYTRTNNIIIFISDNIDEVGGEKNVLRSFRSNSGVM